MNTSQVALKLHGKADELEKQAGELEEQAKAFRRAADLLGEESAKTYKPMHLATRSSIKANEPDIGVSNRKEQLVTFLAEKGAVNRKKILEETGIPKETLNAIFSDKDRFCRAPGGLWKLRERKRKNTSEKHQEAVQ